jgi:hypothetical protein
MELLIATWTLRIAVVAALAVGGVSYQAGGSAIDCVDRALATAVGFTLAGRLLVGWLEPPERKMMRLRKRRDARRAKSMKSASSDSVAAARARRSASTISRSA